ncbi:hypothetical protein [Deinococcus roseus]|uniref:Lipoprotein n=1 Tax=Deinococcus roseus TaxID=392414 RepID=A0ABQ2D6K4_9DEIO|nr:hypothetical protein [Deinococcus roseus]GGJ47962.1 hypothetical protein GCM10008938_37490 [Deinococcus roseus]
MKRTITLSLMGALLFTGCAQELDLLFPKPPPTPVLTPEVVVTLQTGEPCLKMQVTLTKPDGQDLSPEITPGEKWSIHYLKGELKSGDLSVKATCQVKDQATGQLKVGFSLTRYKLQGSTPILVDIQPPQEKQNLNTRVQYSTPVPTVLPDDKQ